MYIVHTWYENIYKFVTISVNISRPKLGPQPQVLEPRVVATLVVLVFIRVDALLLR